MGICTRSSLAGPGWPFLTVNPGHGEVSVGFIQVVDVQLGADVFSAERKLMPSQQHVYVIAKRESVYVERGLGAGAAVRTELVGDCQFKKIVEGSIGVDAESAGADTLGSGAAVVTPS